MEIRDAYSTANIIMLTTKIKFITNLTSIKKKKETKIKKEKDEISRLVSCLKDKKQELEFHKNHSSIIDVSLFWSTFPLSSLFDTNLSSVSVIWSSSFSVSESKVECLTSIQKTDTKIQEMTSTIKDIDMEFKKNKNFKIKAIGSISEITGPCPIQYKSMKIQQTQVQQER
jgi:hypothetical protein